MCDIHNGRQRWVGCAAVLLAVAGVTLHAAALPAQEPITGEDTAWDIRFEEDEYPTLTRGFEGISLPTSGRFCLDPVSGRVIETELELHHPSGGGRLATDVTATVRARTQPRPVSR